MASVINQIKLGNTEYAIAASAYAECSTAADAAAKAASICTDNETATSAFTLIKGVSVQVKFANTNSASNPTLNINGTGAKAIYYKGVAIPANYLQQNCTYIFVYNGTQWDLAGTPSDSSSDNGSSNGSLDDKTVNRISHKVYYDTMRDTTAVWGNNNGAIVVIPEGTTEIANSAYSNNTKVKVVAIPYGVTSIGNSAFYQCTNLTGVEIPDSVTSIGKNAFYYCSNLTSVDIPYSVTSIGGDAFSICQKLSDVYITDIDAWCNIDFGGGPSDYTPYTANPLYYAKNLYLNNELVTELVIPDTVTEIKPYAFYGCNSLTSVEIPDSVTSIGKGIFSDCTSLTSAVIGDGVTSIGDSMFADCKNLTSIELPESVTSIGKSAFLRCFNLPNITIPNNVTSIGKDAFFACRKLTDIEISSNVNSIGESAFGSCEKLSTITVTANNTVYKSIDNVLYTKDGRTLMQYAPAKSETSFTIPSSVTSISSRAFAECANLSSIVIPDGVTSVGSYAFNSCDKLASVVIGNGITNIDTYTFNMCYKLQNVTIGPSVTDIGYNAFTSIAYNAVITILATTPPTLDTNAFSSPARIIVPEGSLQAYCEAEVWRDFIHVIEDSAGNNLAPAEYSCINDLLTNEDDLTEGQATYVTLGTSASIVWCHPDDNRIIVKEGEDRLCVMLSEDILSDLGWSINVGDTIEFSSEAISTLMRDQGTLVFIPSAISNYSQDGNFDNVDTADHFLEYTYNNYTYLNQDIQDACIANGYLPVPVALEINADNLRNIEQFDSEDENGNSVTHFALTIADENGEAGETVEPITICSREGGFDSDSDTPYHGALNSYVLNPNNYGSASYAIYGYILTWTDSLKLMLPTRIEEI